MNAHDLAARLEELSAIDGPSQAAGAAVRDALGSGALKAALRGDWMGHALHPLLTDTVIGTWTSGLLLDLTRGQGADRLVAAGIICALPTALSGATDWADAEERDPRARRVGAQRAIGSEGRARRTRTGHRPVARGQRAAGRQRLPRRSPHLRPGRRRRSARPGGRCICGRRRHAPAILTSRLCGPTACRQGRDLTPSPSVLDALARALRLDDIEREHLYSLIRPAAPPTLAGPDAGGSAADGPAPIRPGVRLLLDGVPTPAFVIGRRLDILATNRMARAMLADFDAQPVRDRKPCPLDLPRPGDARPVHRLAGRRPRERRDPAP